jgi:carboxylesterase type B
VHATIRGFAASLLSPPPGHKALPIERVHRYRIAWRAKGLDQWIDPAVKVCHAADIPIWWGSGKRAGFDEGDLKTLSAWLEPFVKFLQGGDAGAGIGWGTTDVRELRELTAEGEVKIMRDDEWEKGTQVWNTMLQSQLESPESADE